MIAPNRQSRAGKRVSWCAAILTIAGGLAAEVGEDDRKEASKREVALPLEVLQRTGFGRSRWLAKNGEFEIYGAPDALAKQVHVEWNHEDPRTGSHTQVHHSIQVEFVPTAVSSIGVDANPSFWVAGRIEAGTCIVERWTPALPTYERRSDWSIQLDQAVPKIRRVEVFNHSTTDWLLGLQPARHDARSFLAWLFDPEDREWQIVLADERGSWAPKLSSLDVPELSARHEVAWSGHHVTEGFVYVFAQSSKRRCWVLKDAFMDGTSFVCEVVDHRWGSSVYVDSENYWEK